jgi:SAM-dependent methyltransferase
MPSLETKLHLQMYKAGKKMRNLSVRMRKAMDILLQKNDVYGLEWGDPESCEPLGYFRDHFLLPYVSPGTTIAEIGPGGGRWTRYMLNAKRIYAIDYHNQLLEELRSRFKSANITYIQNNGDDFPGIADMSIDFIFSFGVFVHLDIEIINRYLQNMKRLLKPTSNVVINYSDKTKPLAKSNKGFSENNPDIMRSLVRENGYYIYEEDNISMWNGCIVRFGLSKLTES